MPKGKVKRGEIWTVDLEPQEYKEEPAKRGRPALVIQTDMLNDAGHPTTVVIPGTTDVEPNSYPLRVFLGKIQKTGEKAQDTDLLIDQVRAISNDRFMDGPITTLSRNHLKQVESALKTILVL